MEYQWYPGHMTKARRMMEENLKMVDLVIEIADARLPESSRNPDIGKMSAGKSRILILNKADLADPVITAEYAEKEKKNGVYVLTTDARKKQDVSGLKSEIGKALKEKIERDRKRGIMNRPLRAMIAGIPNVGKSTLINSLVGRASAKTGNKPGVTKGKQWVSFNGNGVQIQLLDTPGILWPKFEDPEVGIRLALSGSINDDILDEAELSIWLIRFLKQNYPDAIRKRYFEEGFDEPEDALSCLQEIGRARSVLAKGNTIDISRTASILIDDYRTGRLGRLTIEQR